MKWSELSRRRREPSGWLSLRGCTRPPVECSRVNYETSIPIGMTRSFSVKSHGDSRMQQDELLRRVVETLERLGVKYLVSGSIATIFYGEPRFTNDIDIVVQLPMKQVGDFLRAFPEDEYYSDIEQARVAVREKRQFNMIHPASGLKIDIIVPAMDDFDRSRFARAKRVHPGENFEADFASPEDVIVKKMQFYAEGGSEKHLRDIAGVLRISAESIDRNYISGWAEKLGVDKVWNLILSQL